MLAGELPNPIEAIKGKKGGTAIEGLNATRRFYGNFSQLLNAAISFPS